MPAADALGQYDDSLTNPQPVYTKGAANNGPNKLGIGSSRVTLDGVHHRLFVDDFTNNRILEFNLNSNNSILSHLPNHILGQPTYSTGAALITQSGLSSPYDLTYDSKYNRLFVADFTNNRVLVYDVANIIDSMNASFVLGQADFTHAIAATTQTGMNGPLGVAYDNTRNNLFVSEFGNHRVLVFTLTGGVITNGMSATNVIGQPDFTQSASATTQAGITNIRSMAYDSVHARLFVGDSGANRILVYSGASITNGMNAIHVLGQSNFTTSTANTTQSGLRFPLGFAYDNTNNRLFVADNSNHRVVTYATAVITDGMNQMNVLGQVDFTHNDIAATQSGFHNPQYLSYDPTSGQLFVADTVNNRLLVFDLSPSPSTFTLSSSSNPSSTGSGIIFTAITSVSTTGSLIFKDGGTIIGSSVYSHGSGSIRVNLSAGLHGITVTFGGDANYQASTSAVFTQTVGFSSSSTATISGGGGGGGSRRTSPVSASTTANTHVSSAASSPVGGSVSSVFARHSVSPLPVSPLPSSATNGDHGAALTSIRTQSNLRASPSASARLMATLRAGWQVTVEITQGQWSKVRTSSGKEGYVLTKNLSQRTSSPVLSPVMQVAADRTPPSGPRVTTTSLRLHMSPNLASRGLTTFNPNTTVQLLSTNGEWAEVQAGSHHGWVVRKFLRK